MIAFLFKKSSGDSSRKEKVKLVYLSKMDGHASLFWSQTGKCLGTVL